MDGLGNGCFVFSAEGEKSLKVTKVVFPTVLALGGIEGSVGWTCEEKNSVLDQPSVEIFVHCHLFMPDVLHHNLTCPDFTAWLPFESNVCWMCCLKLLQTLRTHRM